VAGHPLRPATDRRLGRPLPYQLANRTWAHPIAGACKQRPPFSLRTYAVLARVSPGCPPLQGRFPRVTHPSATLLAPEEAFAFDLHVLSMPPAFNLSQDQTLQFIPRGRSRDQSCSTGTFSQRRSADSSPALTAATEHPHKLPKLLVKELPSLPLTSGKTAYSIYTSERVKGRVASNFG
jgi:hypothetical protein